MTIGDWRARLHRWRWWLIALAVVIVIRIALPEILRRVIQSQASAALHAQVAIGDVDLRLWRGGVALEDVAVRPASAPADASAPSPDRSAPAAGPAGPAAAPDAAAPSPTPTATLEENSAPIPTPTPTPLAEPAAASPQPAAPNSPAPPAPGTAVAAVANFDASAIISFRRFAVELRYWPLVHKTIQLREVALDAPRISLDRLASGDLNIMALVPREEMSVEAGATPGAESGAGATPPAAATPAEAAAGAPWKLGLDKFDLTNGRVRFRDFAVEGGEPVEIGIDRVSVEEIALTPEVYGEPARVRLKLGVDEGAIDVDARLQLIDGQVAVTTDVGAQRLPLRRARLYVPGVGWSALTGELDLALTYALEPERQNKLTGTLALRDVAVVVPDHEGTALAWRSLSVGLDSIDLLAQRAAVRQVLLDGARLTVRTRGGERIVALAKRAHAAAEEAAATPSAAPDTAGTGEAESESAPPDAAAAPLPWQWSVAEVKVSDSTLHVLSDQPPIDVGVGLAAANLTSAADALSHVTLDVAVGDGTLQLDGDVRLDSPAFGGTLELVGLPLAPIVARVTPLPPDAVRSGALRADLAIQAGLPAASGGAAAADRVQVTGTLGLADLQAAPPESGGLVVELKDLDLRVDRLAIPGVIPIGEAAAPEAAIDVAAVLDLKGAHIVRQDGEKLTASLETLALDVKSLEVPAGVAGLAPAAAAPTVRGALDLKVTAPRVVLADGKAFAFSARSLAVPLSKLTLPMPSAAPSNAQAAAPMQAQFGHIRIEAPVARLTRTKAGMVLPGSGSEPAAGQAKPTPAPSPSTAPESAGAPFELQIAALRVTDGQLDFTDRAVQPVFSNRFAPIEVDARNIRLPGPNASPLNVDIGSGEQGKAISVRGSLAPDTSDLQVTIDQLALLPFNPYAATYSPYSIADGALSISTKAAARGGKYDVETDVTLHQFDLAGAEGDSLFEQQFGISLTMALALLRDVQGDIDLAIPLTVDREGNAAVDVLAVVRSALRQALIGAISSPLKMLGAAVGGGGAAPVAPAPIAFRLGRPQPTEAGQENAGRLAAFLASRPGMGVELATAATHDDARWLHEQALASEWADEGVFKRSVGFLTERGPRQRIGAYLQARAEDESGELSAEDAATLDEWLAERPPPSPEQLQALAAARLAAVEAELRDKDIDAARLTLAAPPPALADGAPTVSIKLQAAGRRPGAAASPPDGASAPPVLEPGAAPAAPQTP